MLDLERLRRIKLTRYPRGQRVLAYSVVIPNYRLRGITTTVEGIENVPDEPVIYAMNHTDRFNYFPFMTWLFRNTGRFCATWVKGKYYESRWVGAFMEATNNIPTPSRGYIITKDFSLVTGRAPDTGEYEAMRDLCLGVSSDTGALPSEILEQPRSMLGRDFRPDRESYPAAVNALLDEMMHLFVDLNRQAFDIGLDVQVFPQGTRSIRLSRGHTGVAEIALKYRKPVVPIGCNGTDEMYPGNSMFARPGHALYRVGAPIHYDDLAAFHVDGDFAPFSAEATRRYGDRFQGAVDLIMSRINDLVDDKYKFADTGESDGVSGADRFI